MVLIETRILRESPSAIFYRTNVRLLPRVNSYMILIVRRASEGLPALSVLAFVRTFASVSPDVNLRRESIIVKWGTART